MADEIRVPKFRPGERAKFVPDHKSFGRFIRSKQMRDAVVEVAEDIADLAGHYAPRRKKGRPPEGTAMADQFKVNRNAGTLKVHRAHRVKVEVFNSARSAAPNEFGGKHNARHRMLGRAGAAYGDFKPEGGLE